MNVEKISNGDILIVDDTPTNLKLLTSILTANSYNIRPSSNGKLALRSIESKLPDLILLDIIMPDMNGFEVCKKLKENPRAKNIPIIFISALDDIKNKVKAFKVGGVDYITKPFEAEEVLARVQTHLKITFLQKNANKQNKLLKETLKRQRQQEKMLIEQSKTAAMGEMARAIAHQWRQPLNVLALYIQSIQENFEYGDLDKEFMDEAVENSMKQLNFMSETIDNFGDYFKPNDKKENFSLLKNIQKNVYLLVAEFKTHNIEIEVKGDDIITFGYPNTFRQVMLNLINNSKDAILSQQKENKELIGIISIELFNSESEYKVTISDNGGGINEAIIYKIFEPYFTTKFQNQGTGLGLYMVKEIIDRYYNGSIEASNGINGAIFTIKVTKIKN